MIEDFLTAFGCTEKEKILYMTLAEIGTQPASVVARKCGMDRVTAYKNLKRLVERGFLKIHFHNDIQCFGISNPEVLRMHLREKQESISGLMEKFPLFEKSLNALQGHIELMPRLEVFEGEAGIRRLFRDLLFEIRSEHLRQIRMLTSNTFEERLGDVPLSKYVEGFFRELKSMNIDLEVYEATGDLIPYTIDSVPMEEFNPEKLPAAKGTTNIFLAGHSVYLMCYKTGQIGIKIKQSEISQMFHFLLDLIMKNSER